METVTLQSGRVSGERIDSDRCTVFRGIPFAAPPVGDLRYRAPQPVAPWSGVLRADRFGSASLQPLHGADHLLAQFGFAAVPECGISEHCLFLNVWTPAKSTGDRLPVVVWLYGGGFRVGSGSHPVNDGTGFAREGVIVVAPNYRLGSLGFLAHPALTAEAGTSGNYGLLDVVASLRWVRENIAAFGGDPGNVTIFGQSAGAALVNLLMVMDEAGGLFHRAIVHSAGRMRGGPMAAIRARAAAETEGEKFMAGVGGRTLESLRILPADAAYGPPRQWAPIIDGVHVKENPQPVFDRGAQHRVPLLAGYTRDEAASFPMPECQTAAGFEAWVRQNLAPEAEALLSLYGVRDDVSAKAASYELRRDIAFAWQPWQMTRSHVRSGAPGYLFHFDAPPPLPAHAHFHDALPPRGYGAYHGSELWYVFDSLDQRPDWPWSDADRALAQRMCAHWAQFARTGNPTLAGQEAWPAFDAAAPKAMCFQRPGTSAPAARVGAVPNQEALQRLERCFGG